MDTSMNKPGPSKAESAAGSHVSNEIETLLFIHEKKGGVNLPGIPGGGSDSSSSDSDDDFPRKPTASAAGKGFRQ